MTGPTNPKDKRPPQPQATDESFIVTPITIARARYASTHAKSIVDKAQPPATPGTPQFQAGRAATGSHTPTGNSQIGGINTCLLVTLLGVVFVVGGILGGMVGGGLLLWANNPEEIALWSHTPTPSPPPTPTPVPVETLEPTPTPQPSATPSTEDIIDGIIPSVVTVINQQQNAFTLRPEDSRVVGSGVIVDSRGYIATNHHVVESASSLSVILDDGREVVAELVASDPTEDLAILKVNVEGLAAVAWGDSSTVRPGQEVYAIGSPLGDFPNSVSFGIVSGLNRALEMDEHVIDGLIQTDAAINRGSSGGPLINTHGEMIGINTFIIRESEDRGVAEGIAFAIPSERARSLLIPWIAAHSGDSIPIPASGESSNAQ